jgi:hypothetical protein
MFAELFVFRPELRCLAGYQVFQVFGLLFHVKYMRSVFSLQYKSTIMVFQSILDVRTRTLNDSIETTPLSCEAGNGHPEQYGLLAI